MITSEEHKFPCGYQVKVSVRASGFLSSYKWNLKEGICPMHGKNCKQVKR